MTRLRFYPCSEDLFNVMHHLEKTYCHKVSVGVIL